MIISFIRDGRFSSFLWFLVEKAWESLSGKHLGQLIVEVQVVVVHNNFGLRLLFATHIHMRIQLWLTLIFVDRLLVALPIGSLVGLSVGLLGLHRRFWFLGCVFKDTEFDEQRSLLIGILTLHCARHKTQ